VPQSPVLPVCPVPGSENIEYACGVLFMMVLPPYFLVYDQTLLAVPLVMLWSSPAWRWGVALLAVSNVLAANLSFMLGFSLTGFVALAAMFSLARAVTRTTGANLPVVVKGETRSGNCDLDFI
jgi:uncharacterized membrane protein